MEMLQIYKYQITPGCQKEARQWLIKYAKYHNENFKECKVELLWQGVGADVGSFLLIHRYESQEAYGRSGSHPAQPGFTELWSERKGEWFAHSAGAIYHPIDLG